MEQPSKAQLRFLKKRRQDQILIHICRILIFLVFLTLWEISADAGWMDSFIFCSPSIIAGTFLRMCMDHSLFLHMGITLWETLASFFLVGILGLGTAVLLWLFPRLSKILEPYLVILNSLPKSALAPLLIVWLGANQKTIIVAGISVALFGAIINLYTGFQEADKDKLKLIATLRGNKLDALLRVVLPSSIPLIFSVMKVNVGLCLVGVVIGEFIGARQGLGYLIIYGSQVFKLSWVLMSIVILCAAAMVLYSLINLAEKIYLHRNR